MNGGQQTDEELARLAAGGDERAFSDLYNHYFPEIFDYAIRISRDRDVAALVLQSSFLRLHQALQSGALPASIKLQLFAGAHHDLAERVGRRRVSVVEGEEAFVVPDPARLERQVGGSELHELTRLAWQAARENRPEDYELLDLSIRRGLSDEEIGGTVRARPQTVQTRLDRARVALEDSFSSLVLMNYGRRACLELDFLVAEDKWSSSLRRRILHHLAGCTTCQATRRAYPSAADVLASIAVAPAPPGWQAIMLSRLLKAREGGEATPTGPLLPGQAAAAAAPASAPAPVITPAPRPVPGPALPGATAGSGRPAGDFSTTGWSPGLFDRFSDWGGGRGPLVAVLGGGLLIVLVIFGGLCTAGAFDSGGTANDKTTTPTLTRTATRTRTPTVTSTPTLTETPRPQPSPTEEPPTATRVPTNTPRPAPTNTPPPVLTNTPPPAPSATP